MSSWSLNARSFVQSALIVNGWTMRDVIDYLESHAAEALRYPPDADADMMRVCDNENRARAIIYRTGAAVCSGTLDAANRALDFVRS